MRLTGKMVLLFVTVMAIVLGGGAWLEVRRETALLEADMRRDAGFAARIMAHDVTATWARESRRAAIALLQDPALTTEQAQASWVDNLARAPEVVRAAGIGEPVAVSTARALETWVLVRSPAGIGALVLREPLAPLHTHVATMVRRTALTAALLAALALIASTVLGAVVIGRPTRALVGKARRIGAGDLSGRLDLTQRDELGEIAREFDLMTARLVEAQAAAKDETERRLTAVEQLRHADRLMTVGKLASGLAHELGTPMNVVAGRAQMIATGEVAGVEAADSGRVIVEQTRRMTQIIRQLLDFARRGRSSRKRQDVVAPVTRAARLLEPMARKAGVALDVHAAATVVADVDEAQLEQVVTNLLVNAIHATPSGGRVTLAVGAADATPAEGAPRPCARITVTDTGRGMDDPTRARIFEPFFTTKDVGEGTGLGLAVVWGIVTDHGGWIDVTSRPGAGSRFDVNLPVEAPA